jgi:tetratricopeptide (TPR) repeat protein
VKTPLHRRTGSILLLVTLALSSCVTTEKEISQSSIPKENPINQIASSSFADESIDQGSNVLGVLSPDQEKKSQALAHYVNGLILRSKDEPTAALGEWEKVIQLDPEREVLRDMVIQEYFRRGDYKKVSDLLEMAIQKSPKSFSYWTLLAVAYRSDKQWEKATKAAEQAVRLDPSKFPAYQVIYEVALENQKFEEAKLALDRAVAQNSDDYHFWIQLAELYGNLSKEPKLGIQQATVTGFYDHVLELEPNDVSVLISVADYYAVNQNAKKAIEIYENILKKQPTAENIRIKEALSYILIGDKQNAIQVLEKVVEHEPLRYQVFSLLAEIYEELDDSAKAISNYRLSLSANSNQLSPHLKIVLLDLKNKKIDDAVGELDAAREKFPNTPQVSYFYGLVYSEKKDYKKAIETLEDTIRLSSGSNPDILDANFYYYYGAALERDGQFDKSIAQFHKAIELNPDFAEAYNYLGFMYADKNIKLEEARDLIERALSYEPENGAYLDSMGWVYYREGQVDKALTYLQRAITAIGEDSTVYDHLGDVYRKLGEANKAIQNYKKAVDLDPKNKEIGDKLELIKRSLSSTSAPVKNKTETTTDSGGKQ